MRPSRSFEKLLRMASNRLARLRSRAVEGLTHTGPERDRQFAYVIVEALNLWGNFSRSYAMSCLFRPKRVTKQGRVTIGNATVTTPAAVLLIAAQVRRGPAAAAPTTRRDEPAWHDRDLLIKTCLAMGSSHAADVQGALSGNTTVFDHLPTFRNFYAHRNDESAQKAIRLARNQYLIIGVRHPTGALSAPAYKRTQPLILDWLDDMQVVMEFLCD
jgi:hypothetical protein